MAITSGFFNSINKDRTYSAAQIGKYLQHIVSDGVYAYDSSSLQVLAGDGMQVEVQAGYAMLDHHFMENDAPITLTLAAGGSKDRIDAIIMYVDMTERACGITIKEGTPAATPARPVMTRTDVRKEYMLASVYVTKLSTAITQAKITDTRPDTTVCGWVTGLVKQVDTSTLFNQWQAAYEEAYAELGDYLEAQKAAWAEFFNSVADDTLVPVPNVDAIGKAIVVNATGDGYTFGAERFTLYITIPTTGWTTTTDGTYSYVNIPVAEILETDTPIVDYDNGKSQTAAEQLAKLEWWSTVFKVATYNGSIRVMATEIPTTAVPIIVKVVR